MTLHKDKNGNIHDDMGGTALDLFPHQLGPYTPITDAEADAIRASKVVKPTWKELRAAEYPPISDQLDALWKGGVDAEAMKAVIDGIKAKYPKP